VIEIVAYRHVVPGHVIVEAPDHDGKVWRVCSCDDYIQTQEDAHEDWDELDDLNDNTSDKIGAVNTDQTWVK